MPALARDGLFCTAGVTSDAYKGYNPEESRRAEILWTGLHNSGYALALYIGVWLLPSVSA